MSDFSKDILTFQDPDAVSKKIEETIRETVLYRFKREGVVVAMSGGVDSSVTAALCVRALGPERVLGLFLPERDSDPLSLQLATKLADELGIETITEVITDALEGFGCYARRDEAIHSVFPDYGPGWKHKIVLPQNLLDSDRLNFYKLVVLPPGADPETGLIQKRLPLKAYLQIVASVNFKQRTRKTFEYFHADRLNYATTGTPNRLEYDQGFFVKLGDGAADIKPIAHLYKTQVYALGHHIGVTPEILKREPTTDTYTLPQGQDEFYFVLKYPEMDLMLYAYNHKVPAEKVAEVMDLKPEQVERVFRDIERKRAVASYLHAAPVLVEDI